MNVLQVIIAYILGMLGGALITKDYLIKKIYEDTDKTNL